MSKMQNNNDTTPQGRRSARSGGRNATIAASPAAPQYSYIVTLPTKVPITSDSVSPDPNRNYSMVLSEIITTLDPATHSKILQQTTLSIEELIKPKGKFRNGVPPRPQNPWVIYRKDLQAKLVQEQGAEIEFGARVGSISRMASEKWNNEPQEVKQVYEIIAEVAKRVHEQMFPNYKYKPRRKGNSASYSRRSSSASEGSIDGFKNVGDFKSNTSSFQIERLERRKSSESDSAEEIKKGIRSHTSTIPGPSKKPYPSPPLTSGVRASSSSSSHSYLPLPPRHGSPLPPLSPYPHHPSTNQSPAPWVNLTAASSTDGPPQQSIIPSWTLYDTTRVSPANIFTDSTTTNNNNESPPAYNYGQCQQQTSNPLFEMSPLVSCMFAYDRSLTRLFGAP